MWFCLGVRFESKGGLHWGFLARGGGEGVGSGRESTVAGEGPHVGV